MPLPDVDAFADVVVQTIQDALVPILERLAEHKGQLEALKDLREYLRVIDSKMSTLRADDTALTERLIAAERRGEMKEAEAQFFVTTLAELTKDVGAVRERVAVVEVRAQVPGPAGKDGLNGKDGVDGLGFDDLAVDFDGDRTLALRFARDGVTKSFPVTLPFQRFTGVYQDGKSYTQGDTVTWAGSTWHCQEATATKPGDGSKSWQLCVKRGRDGKDGLEGAPGRPGRDLTEGRR